MYIPYNILPVTGVIDPSSNEEVQMQKAVMLGIIKSANIVLPAPVTGVIVIINSANVTLFPLLYFLFCTCSRCD